MSIILLAYVILAVIYTTFKLLRYKPKLFLSESTTYAVSTATPMCLALVLRQHDHLFDSFEAFSVMSQKQDILRTMKFKRDAVAVLHIAGDHCRPVVEPLLELDSKQDEPIALIEVKKEDEIMPFCEKCGKQLETKNLPFICKECESNENEISHEISNGNETKQITKRKKRKQNIET